MLWHSCCTVLCLLFTTTVATLSLTCTFNLTHSPTLTPTSNSSCIKIVATTTIIIALSFADTFIFTPPTLEPTCDGSSSIITVTTASTTTAASTGVGGGGHGVLRVWVVACCVVIILFL